MSEAFMAELYGKFLGVADTFIAQSREMNRHLADIAQSLAKIARSLEVTIAIEGDAGPLTCIVPNCENPVRPGDDYCRVHRRERNEKLGVPTGT